MGSRNKGPDTPNIPVLPPEKEILDYVDKISGVETITVQGPDGKKRRVTQRLPRTPEEEKFYQEAGELLSQAISNIKTLSVHDPASVVDYQPFINTISSLNAERLQDLSGMSNFENIAQEVESFKRINTDLTMRAFDASERKMEESLAHRGVENSTEATEVRAAMARERAELLRETEFKSKMFGKDLQDRQIDTESRLFGLREQGRQGRLSESEADYNLQRQKAEDVESNRQRALDENRNVMDIASGIRGDDMERSRLGLAQAQNAISTFGAQSTDQMNRYNSSVNAANVNYNNQLNKFKNTPRSFGGRLLDTGMAIGGQAAGSYLGGRMSNFASGGSGAIGGSSARGSAFSQLQRVGR